MLGYTNIARVYGFLGNKMESVAKEKMAENVFKLSSSIRPPSPKYYLSMVSFDTTILFNQSLSEKKTTQ